MMDDLIIIILLVVIGAIGIRSTVKHFKRQSGCCGGGDYKPKKKRLANVIGLKTFVVDGMHCEHCKARVEEVVNDISGVAGRVDLKTGELTVSYAQAVDDELIRARIEKAGYRVTEIK